MTKNKEDIKEKYMEYQMLVQQFQQLQQNISALEKHIVDLRTLDDNLDSIKQTKLDHEALVPLGGGIFLKSVLKDNKNVIMGVGANVMVDKSVDDAKLSVNKQLAEVNNVIEQLQEEIVNVTSRIQELQIEFQSMRENALED